MALDEKIPVIERSMDYKKFKFIDKNREVKLTRVRRLSKSIDRKNLLRVEPIVVDKDWYVVDGQTRLSSAMEKHLPIYFIKDDDIEIKDMIILNHTNEKWDLEDYLNYYIKSDYDEYKELKVFSKKWGISTPVSVGYLTMSFTQHYNLLSDFKNGYFKITQRERAEEMAREIREINRFFEDEFIKTQRDFLRAWMILRQQISFEEILITLMKQPKNKITRQAGKKQYLFLFEEILNYGKSKNLIRLM